MAEIIISNNRQHQIESLLASETNFKENNLLHNTDFHKEFLSIKNGNIEEKYKANTTSKNTRNTDEDNKFINELKNKVNSSKFNKYLEVRQNLPCYEKLSEILETIWNNQITLVSGETGCGKTTQIPQYILDKCIMDGDGSITRIICTQPRRISAIAVSERVAEERGEDVGQNSVGYHIRLEK